MASMTTDCCVLCRSPLVGFFDFTGRIVRVCYVCTADQPITSVRQATAVSTVSYGQL